MTPSERRCNAKRRSAQCSTYAIETNHSLCRLARMVAAEARSANRLCPLSGHVNLLEANLMSRLFARSGLAGHRVCNDNFAANVKQLIRGRRCEYGYPGIRAVGFVESHPHEPGTASWHGY